RILSLRPYLNAERKLRSSRVDATYDATLTLTPLDLLCVVVFFYGVYKLGELICKSLRNSSPSSDPNFLITGNENASVSGILYDGRVVPSIDIKDKSLFIDGKFKRRLSRNSRTYNKGVGIFVDGNYVG
ncbi:TPA: hypothetical protein ACP7Q5_004972, partial [Escherichia coli]